VIQGQLTSHLPSLSDLDFLQSDFAQPKYVDAQDGSGKFSDCLSISEKALSRLSLNR